MVKEQWQAAADTIQQTDPNSFDISKRPPLERSMSSMILSTCHFLLASFRCFVDTFMSSLEGS